MILLALTFVLVPFLSLPGLIFPSYTQPLPLLVGWIYLTTVFNLSAKKNLIYISIFYLIYIISLGFLLQGALVISSSSVLVAYCFGFLSFFLYLSLFSSAFKMLSQGDSSLAFKIFKSVRTIILLVAFSSVFQLVPAFNTMLSYFKPRHVDLSGKTLVSAFRGLSGLFPEPSYVGASCALLLLTMFWFSFRLFLSTYFYNPTKSSNFSLFPSFNDSSGSFFYRIYASHLLYFFSSIQNLFALMLSVLVVILAFSPTSILTFSLILSSVFIPVVLQFLRPRVSRSMLYILLLLISLFVLAVAASSLIFPGSRLAGLISSIGDNGLTVLANSDSSSADRAASSISGLFSIFYHPFGLGLNGHRFLFGDCSEKIIEDFALLCGSVWSSSRNHNAFATLLQDGGIVAILLSCLAFGTNVATVFPRYFGSFSWVGRLTFFYFLFLFVVLPSPLGAPTVWIALALILSFFSVSPRFESSDCRPNV